MNYQDVKIVKLKNNRIKRGICYGYYLVYST